MYYLVVDTMFLFIELYSTDDHELLYWRECKDLAELEGIKKFWLNIIYND